MSHKLKNVTEAALTLDEKERAELASVLLDTLGDDDKGLTSAEIEAAQIAEIRRRVANCDESKLIPHEEAMRMAKARQTV